MNTDIEARPTDEEALHARWWLWAPGRENHFRSVSDGIPALIALVAPNGQVEICNRHVLEYFGATIEELKQRRAADTVHPDDVSVIVSAWKSAVKTGVPYEAQCRQRRADGLYRWFQIRGFPLRDVEGFVVFWYVSETDIDDRKRAEAQLDGEKKLLEMVASGRPLSNILDSLCRLFDANAEDCLSSVLLLDRTRTMIEQSIGPGLPLGFNQMLTERKVDSDTGPCGMAASLRTQVVVSDVALETRWGGENWLRLFSAYGLRACWSSPLLSLTGELLGTFAVYRRHSGAPTPFHQALIQQFTHIASIAIERRRSEEALKQSEAFLAKAQQLSSTGSFSWHVPTDEIVWSEQLYRIFELDQAVPLTLELIGTRFHPEDMPLLDELIHRVRSVGADFEHDHRLLLPNQTVKYLHVVAHGTRDSQGRLEYIGAIQDVTEHRLSEAALGKVRSELTHMARVTSLGALTASIAHEVNQPLSGIITNAGTCLRMLAASPPNMEGARETARRMIRDGHRASDVISRLRALFGKNDVTTEPVDLNEAARDVIALSLSELQRSRVSLRPDLASDLPPVSGDRVQLQQVILNLLLNASDAMSGVDDRPRQLVIRTERDEDDCVRLAVQDTGVGIDLEAADRMFDAFYTTKRTGMGIGLSVSRSIIESHHGRLWATPNDGPGATFSFSIPRAREGGDKDDGSARSWPVDAQQEHAMGTF